MNGSNQARLSDEELVMTVQRDPLIACVLN